MIKKLLFASVLGTAIFSNAQTSVLKKILRMMHPLRFGKFMIKTVMANLGKS